MPVVVGKLELKNNLFLFFPAQHAGDDARGGGQVRIKKQSFSLKIR
jgi:hypothetical protein